MPDTLARFGPNTAAVERLLAQVRDVSEQATTLLSFAWMEAWRDCEPVCRQLDEVARQAHLDAEAETAYDAAEIAANEASGCAAVDSNWAIAYAAKALVVRDQLEPADFEKVWWVWGGFEQAVLKNKAEWTLPVPESAQPDPASPFGPRTAEVQAFLGRIDGLTAEELAALAVNYAAEFYGRERLRRAGVDMAARHAAVREGRADMTRAAQSAAIERAKAVMAKHPVRPADNLPPEGRELPARNCAAETAAAIALGDLLYADQTELLSRAWTQTVLADSA
jgi:hypothetical protein